MLRIVNLGRTGLYVALRGGELAILGGRCYWTDPDEVREAARRENAAVADRVLHTAH